MGENTMQTLTAEMIVEHIASSHDFLAAWLGPRKPRIALILGSGLGAFADCLKDVVRIPYSQIPHFPCSKVIGHAGELVVGRDAMGRDALLMNGRTHYYEGHDLATITFPLRVFARLGVASLIVTNAAGGVNTNFTPGDLVLIKDHINLSGVNPLRGEHHPAFGERFPDMTAIYGASWRDLARKVARQMKLDLKSGVYAMLPGPSYETPAEIRMLGELGVDLVGMSTVPEAIVARQLGMNVLGISCVTNLAAGISQEPLSHEEVTMTGQRIRDKFCCLLSNMLASWP